MTTDPSLLVKIILDRADKDTREKMLEGMLAHCKSLAKKLTTDEEKWASCKIIPGDQDQVRACIHEPAYRYYLPDGTLFADVAWLGRSPTSDDDVYTRTVYLSDGILTEWWECCTYTCVDKVCIYKRSQKQPYTTAKRPAEDENERPVAPPLRAE